MPAPSDKPDEWHDQWTRFRDDERFLFEDWIRPATLEDFRGVDVLEGGCGGGQHTAMVAEVARSVTAVDSSTTDLARERNQGRRNVEFVEDDLVTMDLGRQFDVVFCIGVIHHTSDPDRAFDTLYRHCKPGGMVIVWTYSAEGNALVRLGVEPIRKALLRHLPRWAIHYQAAALTAMLYPAVHSIYRIDQLSFLPYYEYFGNFRKLSFERNLLNVYDKLNAPQTTFTTLSKTREWMSPARFEPESISVLPYKGVSYSLVGVKRA